MKVVKMTAFCLASLGLGWGAGLVVGSVAGFIAAYANADSIGDKIKLERMERRLDERKQQIHDAFTSMPENQPRE